MPEYEVVQAQYEHLESIATRFGQWAESNTAMSYQVRQRVEDLMNGGWEGKGAEAFFNEMGAEVLPAMDRFSVVLEQSQHALRQVIAILQQAEQEAASQFGDGHLYTSTDENFTGGEGQRNPTSATNKLASNPRRRWGREQMVNANGLNIAVYGDRVTPRHLQIIEDTLSVIPREHLQLIPRIRVQDQIVGKDGRIIREGGGSGTIGNSKIPLEQQRIVLTYGSLDNEREKLLQVRGDTRRANITLLHEIGHVVDKQLGIVPRTRGPARGAYEEWFGDNRQGTGVTGGPGEWAAEAYSSYIRTGRPEMVGSSPAFRSVTNRR